ncbi:MAG: hypothetical protein QOE96_3669 [Blastocatellia bacterium]|jgi:hypothetical protein|nr:hypothetical protein [Blastocatellia bacterium]
MTARLSLSSKGSIRFYLLSLRAPLLLGLFCFLIYNANLRQIGAGDTFPARYQPLILWHEGTLGLDANARMVAHGHSMISPRDRPAELDGQVTYFESSTYWIIRTRYDHLASLYPLVTPLLVAPLYVPAVMWLDAHGWEQPNIDRVAELMEKVSASLLASIASVLMYLVLRREGNPWSLPLALVFAFGTNTWMISSQALWQHGTGELLIALALLLALAPASPIRTAALGAVCVFMAANRPPDALIAGAIVLFTFWSRRRSALWLLAGAAVPLAALLYYNLNFIGHVAGGYALGKRPDEVFFRLGWSGVPGLLVSPTRGLLVFTPFLIFVPLGLIRRLQAPNTRGLAAALSLAAVAQFVLYSQTDWRAGVSWGPRWLTDLLPIMMWMLAPAPLILRPLARGLLIIAMAASVGVQTVGAFWYTKTSDEIIFADNPASMHAAWNPSNVPFLIELTHPRARAELQCDATGSIDRVGPTLLHGNGGVPNLEPGATLEGWALTCGRKPAQVFLLIDGIVIGAATDFQPRVDVSEAMHTNSTSGWRMTANTLGVSPGERVLQLAVRVEPRSDIRIVREQRVLVIAQRSEENATTPQPSASMTELDAMATRATSLLRERQSAYGYWLTSYTRDPRYEAPQQEMNTYLTSMLVDLLSPIARHRRLEDVVERARKHLAAQIESDGLVRYHGLPNGPTIGTLGAVITPDADDTALVWRISSLGAGDPREQRMLAVLAHYRDGRGLYRTWLAPQNEYQNLNPGRDPNPTDIAIQMHVYLMLHELDPLAAQNLCHALKLSLRDENIWVYYDKAPLVPYLRSSELRRLGCVIPLPADRLAKPAAGQDIWSEAIRLIAERASAPEDKGARQTIANLLVRIGSDDFAQLRRSPPLLYHNDLSATVSRFYWSEDFGYVLWLRLYETTRVENGQRQPTP